MGGMMKLHETLEQLDVRSPPPLFPSQIVVAQ
jgi:hypothetical protein